MMSKCVDTTFGRVLFVPRLRRIGEVAGVDVDQSEAQDEPIQASAVHSDKWVDTVIRRTNRTSCGI